MKVQIGDTVKMSNSTATISAGINHDFRIVEHNLVGCMVDVCEYSAAGVRAWFRARSVKVTIK